MKDDFVGKIFNRLVVLEKVKSYNHEVIYKCLCDCGQITYGSKNKIISGKKKSCGCLRNTKNSKDPLRKSLNRVYNRITKNKKWHNTDITLEFLWDLYIQQGGRCYYTGLDLELIKDNEYTISVDRIDSSKSYMKNNIVLTCRYVNFFKNNLSIDQFITLLENIKNIKKSIIPYFNRLSVRNEN